MKTNKGLMSAIVAIAMLAIPVVASAHSPAYYVRHGFYDPRPHGFYRSGAMIPAYNRGMYSPTVAMPMQFAPRPYAYNPNWAPAPPAVMAAPMMPAPPCKSGYMPMTPAYNYATPYYGSNYGSPMMGNGLANMIRARDNADAMYAQAVRNRNRVRAHHLGNDIAQLNKNIAHARVRDGMGASYGSFAPAPGAFSNRYAYGNNGFGALTPFLGSFIR